MPPVPLPTKGCCPGAGGYAKPGGGVVGAAGTAGAAGRPIPFGVAQRPEILFGGVR